MTIIIPEFNTNRAPRKKAKKEKTVRDSGYTENDKSNCGRDKSVNFRQEHKVVFFG